MASTKHLLLIMLEFRFAKFRGISTFQFCETFVTNLVSQLSGSGHLGNLGLSWLGLPWLTWLGLAKPISVSNRITKGRKANLDTIRNERLCGPLTLVWSALAPFVIL